MEHTFTETSIVGEIVTQFPKASDLFKSYRIDFVVAVISHLLMQFMKEIYQLLKCLQS